MDNTELKSGEVHPTAYSAMAWFKAWKLSDPLKFIQVMEALASTALSGNRQAEICLGTINRLEHGQMVSDRYLLGLCWFLKEDLKVELQDKK